MSSVSLVTSGALLQLSMFPLPYHVVLRNGVHSAFYESSGLALFICPATHIASVCSFVVVKFFLWRDPTSHYVSRIPLKCVSNISLRISSAKVELHVYCVLSFFTYPILSIVTTVQYEYSDSHLNTLCHSV